MFGTKSCRAFLFAILCVFLAGASTFAQNNQASAEQAKPAADETADLAKAAQNPIASLISVPLQNNSGFGVGQYNRTQNVLNIQPVIPVRISENWNLISRIIQPIVWQPYPAPQKTGGEFGLGDMNPTFFFSPSKPSKLISGARDRRICYSHSHEFDSRTRQVQHGPRNCGPDHAGTLGHRCFGEQRLVGGGRFQPQRCEPDASTVVRQLQPEEGLVRRHVADRHSRLGSERRQSMGGSARWWSRTHHALRTPAGQHNRTVVRQCGASGRSFALGPADANSILVPEEGKMMTVSGKAASSINSAFGGIDWE